MFRLQGADIYRVLEIAPGRRGRGSCAPPPARNLLAAVRAAGRGSRSCAELAALFDVTLSALDAEFDIRHAMILMADAPGKRLFTVASRGYPASGSRLRDPVRTRRDRRGGGRPHADTHQPHDDRVCLRPRDPRKRARERPRRPAGDRDPAARTAGAGQPARGAGPRRRPPGRDALCREPAGSAVRLRRRGRAGGDRHPARPRAAAPAGGGGAGRRAAGAGRAAPITGAADRRAALRGERQRVPRRRLPDQGRGRRDPVEAPARLHARAAHRVHQPRAAARSGDPAARPRRQPGGAARAAAAAPARALRRTCGSRRPAAAAFGSASSGRCSSSKSSA